AAAVAVAESNGVPSRGTGGERDAPQRARQLPRNWGERGTSWRANQPPCHRGLRGASREAGFSLLAPPTTTPERMSRVEYIRAVREAKKAIENYAATLPMNFNNFQ
ncbi:hypothetical protein DFQ27_002030, partial [Actinomortierella ambigua]